VREDHRVDQAKPSGKARRQQSRDARQNIGCKEDRAQRSGFCAKTHVKPIRDETGHDKAARERIQREQRRQFEHHAL